MKYSYHNVDGFYEPTLDQLLNYKFILATCSMAGKLFNFGVPLGYFDMVIVDEVAVASEPEVVASFAGLLKKDGQLVLAGDPK